MRASYPQFTESDLALDRHRADPRRRGITYREASFSGVLFSALTVTESAENFGKPCGRYLSLTFPHPALWSEDEKEALCLCVRLALHAFFKESPTRLLVAGLGNRRLTADSLGPLVTERVNATASLPKAFLERFGAMSRTAVAVCAPDVFSRTGIESVGTVGAAAKLCHADAVLAFDALATVEKERLLCVVELTDTGTVPGGGVKRGKAALTRGSLGVPVVAVGVPTVVRVDGEYFLVPRDLEEGVFAIASLLSRAVDLTFGEEMPKVPFSVEELFISEEL